MKSILKECIECGLKFRPDGSNCNEPTCKRCQMMSKFGVIVMNDGSDFGDNFDFFEEIHSIETETKEENDGKSDLKSNY